MQNKLSRSSIYELNATTEAETGFFYDLGASEPDFLAASSIVPEPRTWLLTALLGIGLVLRLTVLRRRA